MSYAISFKLKGIASTLNECPKGGFAYVSEYTNQQGEVTNRQLLTRFSVIKMYERNLKRLEATQAQEGDDVALFEKAKGELIASLEKTLNGERNDAHRQAHDECYVSLGQGIVGHYQTEKNEEGKKRPILNDKGLPMVESVMLNIIDIKKEIVVEGEYKEVKSQAKTIMKRTIEKRANVTKMKRLSLKEGNFSQLKIGGKIMEGDLLEIIE